MLTHFWYENNKKKLVLICRLRINIKKTVKHKDMFIFKNFPAYKNVYNKNEYKNIYTNREYYNIDKIRNRSNKLTFIGF